MGNTSKMVITAICICFISSMAMAQIEEPTNEQKLLTLAEKKFGALTSAEKKLFRAVASGDGADFSSSNEKENDPAGADKWGEERIIKADRITWLCTDQDAKDKISHKGIMVKGARIEGAPDLADARILFSLHFRQCAFRDGIILRYAAIKGLDLSGSHSGPIMADGLKAEGNIYLRHGFKARGEVGLIGAKISGQLDCSDGQFINTDTIAIFGNAMQVGSHVFLRNGFRAEGEVHLRGAKIFGQLDCEDGQFINPGGNAIVGDGMRVAASMYFRNDFRAEGEVNLVRAKISGQLSCKNGKFINPGKMAINGDAMEVGSHVFMCYGFKAEGKVNLNGAIIGGGFQWRAINSPEKTSLDLRSCKIERLDDDSESWPLRGKLHLDGLTYNSIDDYAPRDAESRIEWLNRQPGGQFRPQPYEQLAKVLRESGHEAQAIEVLIAKNEDKSKSTLMSFWDRMWHHFLGWTIHYGYSPLHVIWCIFSFILIGWLLFWAGFKAGIMTPTKLNDFATSEEANVREIFEVYPKFSAIIYSIDLFIPLVKLYQESYWLPNSRQRGAVRPFNLFRLPLRGSLLTLYMWFHIVMGWILSTLLVVGLTGVLRT